MSFYSPYQQHVAICVLACENYYLKCRGDKEEVHGQTAVANEVVDEEGRNITEGESSSMPDDTVGGNVRRDAIDKNGEKALGERCNS